jgi:hypothetical protein
LRLSVKLLDFFGTFCTQACNVASTSFSLTPLYKRR